MDMQDLTRLLAQAIVGQARRQANHQSAAQVLEHQDGSTSANPPDQEVISDVSLFYPQSAPTVTPAT